ncbi:questin oxidase family protein [Tsukamurella sp. 8F]|uniref:questin oxidase family protein n=1 Tax=unclassified Tsukamurella TaxID=2633480 RepID=UPI0023B8A87F|nr:MULTISPECIES: questin oxidase family protein [unclassified Tsukamurella]MDF0531735.1 questin oxidase family protein [Tsukamurella sp. 8J]MDF0588981.1 questin oxidase family protein [Tsukamurella sp. 8F]
MTDDELDDAYRRLHRTGPEFEGYLSNHGPMVAESLARRGHGDDVERWLDTYRRRLMPAPAAGRVPADWRDLLGDRAAFPEWLALFDAELRENPWRDVLGRWWPRLLPGVAAGATHGVIRVGHAVRTLLADGESAPRITELADALGYWAARWHEVPALAAPAGSLTPAQALGAVPPIPDQRGGAGDRLGQLAHLAGWPEAQRALAPAPDPMAGLRAVVIASVTRYSERAHGNPVMLVHASTAPSAILRVLPALPEGMWGDAFAAGWSASAAIYAAYGPPDARPHRPAEATADDAFARAAAHGDEHVIKLADTALDAYAWTGDRATLAAIAVAAERIPPG